MRALTLHQPHASLFAVGARRIETRSWWTAYRGPLAIHAGAKRPPSYEHRDVNDDLPPALDLVAMASCWEWVEHPDNPAHGGAYRWVGPLGAVVATSQLVDCVPIVEVETGRGPEDHAASRQALYVFPDGALLLVDRFVAPPLERLVTDQRPFGDFTPGRWAWLLADVKPLDPPVPAKGRQGLWTWEPPA